MEKDFRTMEQIRSADTAAYNNALNAFEDCEAQLLLSLDNESLCDQQRDNDGKIIKGLKRRLLVWKGGTGLVTILLIIALL